MYLVVLDREQDESFLVLNKERFLFLFWLSGLLLFGFLDHGLLARREGGVLLSTSGACEFLLKTCDREVCFTAEAHFRESICSLGGKRTRLASSLDAIWGGGKTLP